MKSINVEVYDSTTFLKWTDGPKILLHKEAFFFPVGTMCQLTECHYGQVDDMKEFLREYSSPVATVYASMTMKEFLEIVDIRPDLDVRLLVV